MCPLFVYKSQGKSDDKDILSVHRLPLEDFHPGLFIVPVVYGYDMLHVPSLKLRLLPAPPL